MTNCVCERAACVRAWVHVCVCVCVCVKERERERERLQISAYECFFFCVCTF